VPWEKRGCGWKIYRKPGIFSKFGVPNQLYPTNFSPILGFKKGTADILRDTLNSDSYTPEGDGKSTVGRQSQAESKPPLVQDSREIEMIES